MCASTIVLTDISKKKKKTLYYPSILQRTRCICRSKIDQIAIWSLTFIQNIHLFTSVQQHTHNNSF